MDGLSGAASVIAVVDVSAKVASLCFQYAVAVKDAKNEIERLQKTINNIKHVLEHVAQLLEKQSQLQTSHKLLDSVEECRGQLIELTVQLEPRKTRKAMQRFGMRALKWPFTSKQVDKIVASLEKYQQTFNLALQVDQTDLILSLDQKLSLVDRKTDTMLSKIDIVKLPIAIGASFDSHKDEHTAKCLENTRIKLLSQIMEWASNDDDHGKPIFWLNGMAGTGKSTIARTIAESFASQRSLGASFFFKRGEGERGNATRFFTTIATELMVRVPEMRQSVREAIDTDPAICNKALKDQFEKLVVQPISAASSQRPIKLVVVIDALDECERDEDIRAILQLLSQIQGSLRVFVTSRPELYIRLGFKQMPDGIHEDLVLHEVAKETIEHDIRLYLEHELSKTRYERSLPLEWPGDQSIRILVGMAVPLFIFASTVCRFVGEISGNPRRRLHDILQYETKDVSKLDITYLPILNSLFATQVEKEKKKLSMEFQEIVGSIVVLASPLPIKSLARLLRKDEYDIHSRLDSLHSVLSIPERKDLPIRLLHLSFRDFLTDTEKKDSPFWVDTGARHKQLVFRCLELMSGPGGLRQNMCDMMPGTHRTEIDEQTIARSLSVELQYACRYWIHHLEHSQIILSDRDQIHLFLKKHFLQWLEAMSLIGETNKCIHLIGKLQQMNVSKGASSNFLRDAKRFTWRFRSILEDAPLQIYCSALIFAPQASIIRQIFKDQMIDEIEMLSKREGNWDACRSVLEGHTEEVNTVALSPDGQLVASASDDYSVRLWETTTGSCRSVLEGHTDIVSEVAFSPDGQLVVSVSEDATVRLWETTTGSCRSVLKGHIEEINAVAFSPDGQLIASAGVDGTVRLWETTGTESCRFVLEGHTDAVHDVAFSPDGNLVASASGDNTIRLWETTATGSCYSVLEGHTDTVNAVAFSPDGKLIASAADDEAVRIWETLATGLCRSVLEGHTDTVNAVAFSPDGKLIASASEDDTVHLWETDGTGSCRGVLEGHTNSVFDVAFSPDGNLVASASGDNTVRLWEISTLGSCRSVLKGHSDSIYAVAFSTDGELLASASDDNSIRLWETAEMGSSRSMLKGNGEVVNAVAISPDGQLVASASDDDFVRLWDTATGLCRRVLKGHDEEVNDVAFSPDGQLVASASDDGTIRLWDTATGSRRRVLEGHTKSVYVVVFSPDGQLLVSGSFDNTVRLWGIDGSCRSVLEGHTDHVVAVTFSLDGQRFASGSDDSTIRLWDIATEACYSVLKGHTDSVYAVAFSPDGQLVASASDDDTVRLWETDGTCRNVLEDQEDEVDAFVFSQDGRYLRTNQGDIPLLPPSTSPPASDNKSSSHVFVRDQWIVLDQQLMLWLPAEYRPNCSATQKGMVCLGHTSGRITLLRVPSI